MRTRVYPKGHLPRIKRLNVMVKDNEKIVKLTIVAEKRIALANVFFSVLFAVPLPIGVLVFGLNFVFFFRCTCAADIL